MNLRLGLRGAAPLALSGLQRDVLLAIKSTKSNRPGITGMHAVYILPGTGWVVSNPVLYSRFQGILCQSQISEDENEKGEQKLDSRETNSGWL